MLLYWVQNDMTHLVDDSVVVSSACGAPVRFPSSADVAGERPRRSRHTQPRHKGTPWQWGRGESRRLCFFLQRRQTLHWARRSQAQTLWCLLGVCIRGKESIRSVVEYRVGDRTKYCLTVWWQALKIGNLPKEIKFQNKRCILPEKENFWQEELLGLIFN